MKSIARRALGAFTATATVTASCLALSGITTAPAHSAPPKITDYGFQGAAYGSRAHSDLVGLRSDKTAHSLIGCTRKTGKKDRRILAAAQTPTNNPHLGIGVIESKSGSYRSQGRVGSKSVNKVAQVRLGATPGINLTIDALTSTTDAWASKNGKLHAAASYDSGDISLNSGVPLLDAVFAGPNDNLGTLLDLIRSAPGDGLVIPGLARIREGGQIETVKPQYAVAKATALQVSLFGDDGLETTQDDTQVTVGYSKSRINRGLTVGVFSGYGYGLDASLVNGVASVDRLAEKRLGCQGTGGRVLSASTAATNIGNLNLIGAGAAGARVFGKQKANSARAWTEGRIATFTLGSGAESIVIKGVTGRASVKRLASGKVVKSSAGSDIAVLRIGGTKVKIPKPGRSIKVGNLARLEFFVDQTKRSSITVTAVRIVLLDATAGVTAVNLGVAKAALRKS